MDQIRLAGCVISNDEGSVLLLHRNTAKRRQWEIPGGKVEPGEDATKTAIREVREEVGIDVEIIRELGVRSFDEDGYTMVYTWFLAKILNGEPGVQEPATHDRCEYLDLARLEALREELSPNTRNFVAELTAGRITL
jgi:8-oxo-dGTP diphosphatase